jgi:glutathione peroxidase
MAEKVSVKGDDIDPLFKWLVQQSNEMAKNLPTNTSQDLAWRDYLRSPITWNFTKFLIDENGNLIAVFHNKVNPMSEEITKYLN